MTTIAKILLLKIGENNNKINEMCHKIFVKINPSVIFCHQESSFMIVQDLHNRDKIYATGNYSINAMLML